MSFGNLIYVLDVGIRSGDGHIAFIGMNRATNLLATTSAVILTQRASVVYNDAIASWLFFGTVPCPTRPPTYKMTQKIAP